MRVVLQKGYNIIETDFHNIVGQNIKILRNDIAKSCGIVYNRFRKDRYYEYS